MIAMPSYSSAPLATQTVLETLALELRLEGTLREVATAAEQLAELRDCATADARDSHAIGQKLGAKIREAQLELVPYMLVVGEQDARQGTVTVRDRLEGDCNKQEHEHMCRPQSHEIDVVAAHEHR